MCVGCSSKLRKIKQEDEQIDPQHWWKMAGQPVFFCAWTTFHVSSKW